MGQEQGIGVRVKEVGEVRVEAPVIVPILSGMPKVAAARCAEPIAVNVDSGLGELLVLRQAPAVADKESHSREGLPLNVDRRVTGQAPDVNLRWPPSALSGVLQINACQVSAGMPPPTSSSSYTPAQTVIAPADRYFDVGNTAVKTVSGLRGSISCSESPSTAVPPASRRYARAIAKP